MNVTRAAINPLITPGDVPPTSPELEVACVFNAATARYGKEIILLLRVAEVVRDVPPDEVAIPTFCHRGECVRVERFAKSTPGLDLSDSRLITLDERHLLTSLSHLRVARSTDGLHFTIDAHPAIFPTEPYEAYGLEDPRITEIDGTYYINYSVVSEWGIAVGLATTTDFKTFTKRGLIFGPENKNVAIFPEKINGHYLAMHRPASLGFGALNVWLSSSPDLYHWGGHRTLISKRLGMWDSQRVGAGSVPIKTDGGWLAIYHGANEEQGYCLGALLLDPRNPHRVMARSAVPILAPDAPYERTGFYGNVVFTCGTVLDDAGLLHIYYGASDKHTCRASVPLCEVLDHLMIEKAA